MSHRADLARLERILNYIDDVMEIVKRHGTTEKTLKHKEGQYAVLLCLTQIGELLGKISTPEFVERLPIQLATGLRNMIVHNYEGVDMTIVGSTIRESLPELKRTIQALIRLEA